MLPPRVLAVTAALGVAVTSVSVAAAPVAAAPVPAARAVVAPDAAVTAENDNGVTAAWNWLASQRGTGTPVVSTSTIRPAKSYTSSSTGAVGGTFTVSGTATPPVLDPASIVVDRPATVPPTYAKPVSGHLNVPSAPGRFVVQAYKASSSGRVRVPLQAAVAADGTFTIDLGSVSSPPNGTWALGLLDSTNAYAPFGTAWPAAPVYDGWTVRAVVVTDTAYTVGEQPARADGTFTFATSAPGAKCFQLVDASGAVLAEYAPDAGLLRSYAGGTTVSSYDQALAVVTAITLGQDATTLTAGLIAMQRSGGGFVDVVDVRNPAGRNGTQWTGNSAVAAWALLRRVQTMSTSDAAYAATRQAAVRATTFLEAQRRSDGLLDAGQSGDGSASPTWVSTEHNLDAWFALRLAGVVLGDSTAASAATTLASAVVTQLWDSSVGHFRRGLSASGPDDTDALDVSSWGTLFLRAVGRTDLAAQSLAHTSVFASVDSGQTGYRSYHPQPVFPSAPDNVWVEGSAGVALAQLRSGATGSWASTLSNLRPLQRPDGSLPYATTADDPTSMTTQSSVAAATWFVLASLAATGPTIWD